LFLDLVLSLPVFVAGQGTVLFLDSVLSVRALRAPNDGFLIKTSRIRALITWALSAYMQASKLATQDCKEEVRTYYGIALLQSLHWEILPRPPLSTNGKGPW
jgi:hypothetical protein